MVWVIPLSKREGEEGVGAVLFHSCVACMLLPFIGKKTTWHSFCSAIVARPHPKSADSRISIEKGNKVARPLCHFFSLWRGIENGSHVARPPARLPLDRKRKVWQKSLVQREFLLYLNGTMGNSCKFMIKVTK